MKKQRIIDYGVIILSCVLLFLVLMPHIMAISSFFRYQNTGRIYLEIDGSEVILNNIDIAFNLDDDSVEAGKITNGKFKFWKGDYGSNTCNFKIPAELYRGHTDIFFEAEYVNVDIEDWNINDFNINISITTGDEIRVYANGFVKAKRDKDPYYFIPISKEITEKDNIIRLYASNI